MRVAIPLVIIGLTGCTQPEMTVETPPPTASVDEVSFHLTGMDGAAVGQIGIGAITPDGTLQCALYSPPPPDWQQREDRAAPSPVFFEASVPGLYPALRELVVQNGAAAVFKQDTDGIFYRQPDQTIAVLPDPGTGMFPEQVERAFFTLINADGRNCLQFG